MHSSPCPVKHLQVLPARRRSQSTHLHHLATCLQLTEHISSAMRRVQPLHQIWNPTTNRPPPPKVSSPRQSAPPSCRGPRHPRAAGRAALRAPRRALCICSPFHAGVAGPGLLGALRSPRRVLWISRSSHSPWPSTRRSSAAWYLTSAVRCVMVTRVMPREAARGEQVGWGVQVVSRW